MNDEEYRKKLTPEQYEVTRLKATERPFTGKYHDTKDPGVYVCICCEQNLFSSETKYDSGCGWPSFWQPMESDGITEEEDLTYGMRRIEVTCSNCGAHIGHVFPDGPEPTGKRYCNNGLCLNFIPKN